MIKVLALDIDGVLTDGRVLLGEKGRERKMVSFRDFDSDQKISTKPWFA